MEDMLKYIMLLSTLHKVAMNTIYIYKFESLKQNYTMYKS
jgi:hypothetical protein